MVSRLRQAAATAALCRSVESVMVATLPAVFVLPLASGVYIPREVLPDALGDVLVYAPSPRPWT
ncbi:hypothetical protein [Streptomyces sp. KL2]|uniref:hypothetical protein n=1 Tax=Streptomyces sp. KL2 TaxID=3050126 RepID=UPI00397924DF